VAEALLASCTSACARYSTGEVVKEDPGARLLFLVISGIHTLILILV